ncbi:protein IN CHLOROPLAST ATPASE BIOGENESIS, chloroplastic-like isoform X2 [Wolffia australiana]
MIKTEHVSFIEDIAVTKPPEHLECLMNILTARGETVVPPGSRAGLIPLVIPLSRKSSGSVTALLRWPTSPPGMEMPVVEVHKHGVWLLAKNVDQYIHRILVQEDQTGSREEFCSIPSLQGIEFYKKGDFSESGITDVNVYLLKKVGLFPDIIESKAEHHLERGDNVSALITGEFYTKNHFPGFGRPFAFNANILLKSGRATEAKDAARGALKSPWWTLGYRYHEVAKIAEWDDEQIEFIMEKVSDDGKKEDLKKGKAPAQVALDEAAFLLDLASIEGTWDDGLERIAQCYAEGGLDEIAKFVLYRD